MTENIDDKVLRKMDKDARDAHREMCKTLLGIKDYLKSIGGPSLAQWIQSTGGPLASFLPEFVEEMVQEAEEARKRERTT